MTIHSDLLQNTNQNIHSKNQSFSIKIHTEGKNIADNNIILYLSGSLLTKDIKIISAQLAKIILELPHGFNVKEIIGDNLYEIDSNISWYIRKKFNLNENTIISNFTPEQKSLFNLLSLTQNISTKHESSVTFLSLLNYFAVMYIKFFKLSYAVLFKSFPSNKAQLKQMWTSVLAYSQEFGFKGLPVFGLTMFFLGIVLSFQAAHQLKTFAADLLTVDFLAVSVFRELGPLFTGILLASRSGSAISSQLGSMVINQEIDVMKVMNLKPVASIIWPQVVSMTLISPLLAIFSITMSLVGGWLIFTTYLDQNTTLYLDLLYNSVSTGSIIMFLWKTPIFAFCTGIISCMQGLEVKSDTVDIGKRTTAAVVTSLITILTLDGVLSLITTYLEW